MEREPIRVWLEPGYDGGRTGCWMLDWPGCFCQGRSRSVALGRVPSAVARFVDWLAEHGQEGPGAVADEVTVVEEVPAVTVEGYEVNALFAADRRAVTSEELTTTFRRLEVARRDLLGMVGAALGLSASSDGPAGERSGLEVVRHIGGAEAWLASRLDGSARYSGPEREGEPMAYLAATREWATAQVRAEFDRDPALSRVDGKGEEWTLAKVLRRLLYHSLDHLDELDRRIATGEGRLDRLEIRTGGEVEPHALAALLRAGGINARGRDPELVGRMLAGTPEWVSAWDGGRLVGFARAITDGVTNAYVSSVVVHPRWQDRGLGRRLVEMLIDDRDDMKFVLTSREGTEEFYERLGFTPDPRVLVRQRRRMPDP